MKRKINRVGTGTLTLSLPIKWVKKQGIEKGDEIDVKEQGKDLIVSYKGGGSSLEKITIDISNLNDQVIRWFLSALHKCGYNEIEIIYNKPWNIKIIQELIKDLFTGFIIIKQSEKRCVLKSIAQDLESEFDITLRRVFLVTMEMGESIIKIIKQGKLADLKELTALERTNNQLTNFCERILNKRGYKDDKKTNFMYVIVWNLEKICDSHKYICNFLSKNSNTKISKATIELYEKVNAFIKSYYDLFYNFDITKLNNLSSLKEEINNQAQKIISKTKEPNETTIINYLLELVSRTVDFSSSIIALNDKKLSLQSLP